MNTMDKDLVIGRSFLKQTVETKPEIIQQNKNTILHHICSPRKPKDTNTVSLKNKPSISTSIGCVLH